MAPKRIAVSLRNLDLHKKFIFHNQHRKSEAIYGAYALDNP